MRFDDTAAAYGLFQVVFADLATHLATAVFHLRRTREPGLAFEIVFRQDNKRTLKQLRRELRRFDECSGPSESVVALKDACDRISTLAVWRNDRVHARVQWTEHGYALYDWRTRKRLSITCGEIEENIGVAIKTIIDIKTLIPQILDEIRWDEEMERLLGEILSLSEGDDCSPPKPDED